MTEANIKTASYEEFKALFPKVLEKKRFYAAETELKRTLVAYAEKCGVVFITPESPGARGCIAFWTDAYNWNAKKGSRYRAQRTAENAEEEVEYFLNGLAKHRASVKERRAERTAPHTLKVEDILYASWGYDQTNIDYYKVTKTTKHTVDLVKIGKTNHPSGDSVSPNPSAVCEETFTRKRASAGNYVTIDNVRSASQCLVTDSHYQTPWNMGH